MVTGRASPPTLSPSGEERERRRGLARCLPLINAVHPALSPWKGEGVIIGSSVANRLYGKGAGRRARWYRQEAPGLKRAAA